MTSRRDGERAQRCVIARVVPRHCEGSPPVIASEAWQSTVVRRRDGLPRFAFHEQVVIANAVKQSRTPESMTLKEDAWIATACGLAMTMLVQGPSAVSGRIRETRNDGPHAMVALRSP